jgi:hypothetical protein
MADASPPNHKVCLRLRYKYFTILRNICPTYSGSRDQEDCSSRSPRANSSWDPIWKIHNTKKAWQSGSRGKLASVRPWVQIPVCQEKKEEISFNFYFWVTLKSFLGCEFFKGFLSVCGDNYMLFPLDELMWHIILMIS